MTVNALFRHFCTVLNNVNEEFEENIDDFLNTELNVMRIALIQVESESSEDQKETLLSLIEVKLLNASEEYSEESQHIAEYLTILYQSEKLLTKEF